MAACRRNDLSTGRDGQLPSKSAYGRATAPDDDGLSGRLRVK